MPTEKIAKEPSSKVVSDDLLGLHDHLTLFVDKSSFEVY